MPFAKPEGYDASQFELLRRYLAACENATCALGFPSCNTRAVPNGKFDMNNCEERRLRGRAVSFDGASSTRVEQQQ